MYLLDTDICIELTRRNLTVVNRMRSYTPEQLGISVITLGELLLGVHAYADSRTPQQDVDYILRRTTLLSVGREVAVHYAAVRHTLKKLGMPIGSNDFWIAAHALALDLTLVTNNEREFSRVPDLRIENWTKPA